MFYPELLTCSLIITSLVSGQRNSKLIDAQPRLGYSTSIVHSIPNAESSVKFNFQPGENRARYTNKAPVSSKIFTRTSLSGDPNNPNSFNVGYNLTFNNNDNRNTFNTKMLGDNNYILNKKFDNAEVITGRSKKNEKVRAPNINIDLSAKDFVVSALSKRQQLNLGSTSGSSNIVSQQNIFKATKPDPIQRNPSGRRKKFKHATVESNDKDSARSFAPTFNHEAALRNGQIFSFNDAASDNFPAGSEVFSQKTSANGGTTEINGINIEAHIPKNLRGIKPLPIDTSLLKDPVLTTSYSKVAQNPKVIPIHFDITPIQSLMQNPQNFADAGTPSVAMEDHHSSSPPGQTNFRIIYGKREAAGHDYGKKRHGNYDEDDVYKIVSLRPPPVGQSIVY